MLLEVLKNRRQNLTCAGAQLDDDYGAWPPSSRRTLETPLEALTALERKGDPPGGERWRGKAVAAEELREELRVLLERATFGGLGLAQADADESRMFDLD